MAEKMCMKIVIKCIAAYVQPSQWCAASFLDPRSIADLIIVIIIIKGNIISADGRVYN